MRWMNVRTTVLFKIYYCRLWLLGTIRTKLHRTKYACASVQQQRKTLKVTSQPSLATHLRFCRGEKDKKGFYSPPKHKSYALIIYIVSNYRYYKVLNIRWYLLYVLYLYYI